MKTSTNKRVFMNQESGAMPQGLFPIIDIYGIIKKIFIKKDENIRYNVTFEKIKKLLLIYNTYRTFSCSKLYVTWLLHTLHTQLGKLFMKIIFLYKFHNNLLWKRN
tara:strand:+ start:1667 stop:1984 length:318 start_codon:yes stop_codon:yes gene_type:complete